MMEGDGNLEQVANEDLSKWVKFARDLNERVRGIRIPNLKAFEAERRESTMALKKK